MTCWLCGFETTELTTNPEAPTCKNGPCHVCIEVATVDEEINQAVATLHRLLTKRRDLRSEQNRVHGCLINRLPTELKNYVFELLLPLRDEWGERLRGPRVEQSVTPTTLASVCRGWRDVAWSNPSLWSTIYITAGASNSTTDSASQINFMCDWILRSRTLPLRVVLCNKGKSAKEFQSILDAIGHCSDRFHSLSLDGWWKFSAIRNFQSHLLKRLRLIASDKWQPVNTQSLFDPNMSLEKIEISGVPFQSLQVSWNHLTSAKVGFFDLEEISQLFQHASQMSCCHIFSLRRCTQPFLFPLLIHHRLKIFGVFEMLEGMPTSLFSLTLPSLQEFHTDDIESLYPAYLPALVQRSSCPLTRLTFKEFRICFYSLQPLRGVTDIVLESLYKAEAPLIKELLIDGYFPDLRHLTLRLELFLSLWDMGIINSLLDRKRPRRLDQLLVIDDHPSEFDMLWNTHIGKQLKALDISMREDGFEFILQD